MRLGALEACAELLGGVARTQEAAALRRHLVSAEAASLVGYASSVFLQARRNPAVGSTCFHFACLVCFLLSWYAQCSCVMWHYKTLKV